MKAINKMQEKSVAIQLSEDDPGYSASEGTFYHKLTHSSLWNKQAEKLERAS